MNRQQRRAFEREQRRTHGGRIVPPLTPQTGTADIRTSFANAMERIRAGEQADVGFPLDAPLGASRELSQTHAEVILIAIATGMKAIYLELGGFDAYLDRRSRTIYYRDPAKDVPVPTGWELIETPDMRLGGSTPTTPVATPPKPKAKPQFKPKVCDYCSTTFTPNAGGQRFCKPLCRFDYYATMEELKEESK